MKEIHIEELDEIGEKKVKELNDAICKRIAKGLDINYVQKQDRVIQELVKENYILHSIIKEVREYTNKYFVLGGNTYKEKVLEILEGSDKE